MIAFKFSKVFFLASAFTVMAQARTVHVSLAESPGSNSGQGLFSLAETALQDEAKRLCGVEAGLLKMHDMEIKVFSLQCGNVKLDTRETPTMFNCYPDFVVEGNLECPD